MAAPLEKGVINMAERVRVLLSEEEVDAKIKAIGEQISRDYAGKSVHLVCVLKGGSLPKELRYRYLWTLCRFPVTEVKRNQAVSYGL